MDTLIIIKLIEEFRIQRQHAEALIEMLDAGDTTPFIARYRKERHGGMDDQAVRAFAERLTYLRALETRKTEVIASIDAQGKLTDDLRRAIEACETQAQLEGLYKPYKQKRRTRASIARERGLEPLADIIWAQGAKTDPGQTALSFIDSEKGVNDTTEALQGASDIIAERISLEPAARNSVTGLFQSKGRLSSKPASDDAPDTYRDYFDASEPVRTIPPHRILAMNRGEKDGALKVSVDVPDEEAAAMLRSSFTHGQSRCAKLVGEAAEDAYTRLLKPSVENVIRTELTERAQEQAARVFADNLKHLLMQPPLKGRAVLGLDPGIRTGCKWAAVDETGYVLETGVIFPMQTHGRVKEAEATVRRLAERHNISAIAIGNGTASRETAEFAANLIKNGLHGVQFTIVNEAGASVYSASPLAAAEFPGMDVTLRGAVSIARRLQDPLPELIKIDPKSIGIGQYQHDIKASLLDEALGGVVEDCVNNVGVDLNTASVPLLTRVAGIGPSLAQNIVDYRTENGRFESRAQLKKVKKLGPKAFEQCAGFLRVTGGKEPLDATGVHPESYKAAKGLLSLVKADMKKAARGLPTIDADVEALGVSDIAKALDIGTPTLRDIIQELKKPGRDPRDGLPPPLMRDDVLSIEDLKPGMRITGVVRNVTDFGAFIDIGVHRDGLLHISQMAGRVRRSSEAVKVGDTVEVTVLECDMQRNRISLSQKG